MGIAFHAFEWLFVRIAPILLIAALIGIFLIGKSDKAALESKHKKTLRMVNSIRRIHLPAKTNQHSTLQAPAFSPFSPPKAASSPQGEP